MSTLFMKSFSILYDNLRTETNKAILTLLD